MAEGPLGLFTNDVYPYVIICHNLAKKTAPKNDEFVNNPLSRTFYALDQVG